MKYSVFRVTHDVENGPFDQINGLILSIENGAYVFRKPASGFIEVAYPVQHFWVMREG